MPFVFCGDKEEATASRFRSRPSSKEPSIRPARGVARRAVAANAERRQRGTTEERAARGDLPDGVASVARSIQPMGASPASIARPAWAAIRSTCARSPLGWHRRPFYGLQPQGLDGRSKLHRTIPEMALHYIAEIRRKQPSGPAISADTLVAASSPSRWPSSSSKRANASDHCVFLD